MGKEPKTGDGRQAGAGTAVGREPIFWGWKAGAGTAMGREPTQGTEGKQG